jgi:DNA-binding HxlR family transcriptional regulator
LNDLEKRKVIDRTVYPETPPRVEYALAKKGIELLKILGDLADWVVKWDKKPGGAAKPVNEETIRPLVRNK